MADTTNIQWNEFEKTFSKSIGELRHVGDFSDVILVCDDYTEMKAHKIILSSASSFFDTLLRRLNNPNPLIYLMDVDSETLGAIVDFIYYGEAKVKQENLRKFIIVAKKIKLVGLDINLEQEVLKMYNLSKMGKCSEFRQKSMDGVIFSNVSHQDIDNPINMTIGCEIPNDDLEATDDKTKWDINKDIKQESDLYHCNNKDLESSTKNERNVDLDQRITKMLEKTWNKENNVRWSCKMCDKSNKSKTILFNHVEAKHIDSLSYSCNHCDYTGGTRFGMKEHNKDVHGLILRNSKLKNSETDRDAGLLEEIYAKIKQTLNNKGKQIWNCTDCEYSYGWQSAVVCHVESRHIEGLNFSCNECDFSSNVRNSLILHKRRHNKVFIEFEESQEIIQIREEMDEQIQEDIDSKMEKLKHHSGISVWKCLDCGKVKKGKTNITEHVETRHIRGYVHKCEGCDYVGKNRMAFRRHRKLIHNIE